MKTLGKNIFSLLLAGLMVLSMAVIPAGATVDGDENIPDGLAGTVLINETFNDEGYAIGAVPDEIEDYYEGKTGMAFTFRLCGGTPTTEGKDTTDYYYESFASEGADLTVVEKYGSKALKVTKTSTDSSKSHLALAFGLVKDQTDTTTTDKTEATKIKTGIVKMSADLAFDNKGTEADPVYLPPASESTQLFMALSYKTNNGFVAGVKHKNKYVQIKGSGTAVRANGWDNEDKFNHVDLYVDYTGATPKTWAVVNGIKSEEQDVATPSGSAANYKAISEALFGVYQTETMTGMYIDNLKVTHYTEAPVVINTVEKESFVKVDATETENENGFGAAITINDAQAFTKMIWVFATGNTADDRFYSAAVDYPGAVSGNVTLAAAFVNGHKNLSNAKTITGVDAIFKTADGTEYYTNEIDAANKLN